MRPMLHWILLLTPSLLLTLGCSSADGTARIVVVGESLGTFGNPQNHHDEWDPTYHSPGIVEGNQVTLDLGTLDYESTADEGPDHLWQRHGHEADGGYEVHLGAGGPEDNLWRVGAGMSLEDYAGSGTYPDDHDTPLTVQFSWRGTDEQDLRYDEAYGEDYLTFTAEGDADACTVTIEGDPRRGSLRCEGLLPVVDGTPSSSGIELRIEWVAF